MFFNTWQFAIFAIAIVVAYFVTPPRLRAYLLILSGLVFYATAGIGYLAVIVGVTLATYVCARMLQSTPAASRRTLIVTIAILALVGALCYFKYLHWISRSLAFAFPHLPSAGLGPIIVPLAISFFTFEFIHFVTDVYTGRIKEFSLKQFAAFAFFFPTMVAGPIKRFRLFSPQLDNLKVAEGTELQTALYRITCGLFKKTVIVDPIRIFAQPVLHPAPGISAGAYAVAMIATTIAIYYDLSGYTDIAIGFAMLFGVRVPENFARPYWAPNVIEFWQRWHISLTSWVRDYVFVPLARNWRRGSAAGSTRGRLVTVACFLIVMLIIGLWHGSAWHFAAWGLWNGLCLAIYYGWRHIVVARSAFLRKGSFTIDVASIATTYASFAFGIALIAAPSTSDAMMVYRSFF